MQPAQMIHEHGMAGRPLRGGRARQPDQAGEAGSLCIDQGPGGIFPKIVSAQRGIGKALFGQVPKPLLEKRDAIRDASAAFFAPLGLGFFVHRGFGSGGGVSGFGFCVGRFLSAGGQPFLYPRRGRAAG